MRDFRQLRVWEDAHWLTLEIYKITKEFPKEEVFALTNQLRRASTSIGSNMRKDVGAEAIKITHIFYKWQSAQLLKSIINYF